MRASAAPARRGGREGLDGDVATRGARVLRSAPARVGAASGAGLGSTASARPKTTACLR